MPRSKEQFTEIREKTRQLILESALELFSQKGYNGTSINEIAEKAKVSKGLAYNYFNSKQHLLQAIIEDGLKYLEGLETISQHVNDPYERFNIMIEESFRFISEKENYWRLYMSLLLQPEVMETTRDIVYKFSEDFYSKLEEVLKEMGVEKPSVEIRILTALLDGISLHYFFYKKDYPLDEVKNQILKNFSREEIEKRKSK